MTTDDPKSYDDQATRVNAPGEDAVVDPEATINLGQTGGPSTAAGMVLTAGTMVADRYEVVRELGAGGMGVVYLAHDRTLDIDVALKVLRPEVAEEGDFLERFRNELLLARAITHRNVVRIHDIGQDGSLTYMSMDYIPGQSLQDLLRDKGKLKADEAVAIMLQVARAMAEAHHQSVVHRDMKPANIMIDEEDQAYVSDFGIARSLSAPGMTQTGMVLGTPHYLSPEQARGERVDGRSDIYTLGIIFVEMLSGKLPFPGGTLIEVLSQRMAGRTCNLSELGVAIPPAVCAIIERCLAVDVEQRYQTVDEMVADLEDQDRPLKRAKFEKRRKMVAWAAAIVAGLAVLLFGGSLLRTWITAPKVVDQEAGTPAPAPGPKYAVAVLPFDVAGGGEGFAWAGNGVAETITGLLAENEDLRVVDSVRVIQRLEDLGYQAGKLRDNELEHIAEVCEVDRLVWGSVQVVGDQVQIEARFKEVDNPTAPPRTINAQQGSQEEFFALVKNLGAELQLALDVGEQDDEVAGSVATASAAAMKAYTEGLEKLSQGDTASALQALEAAVAEDPSFGAAWVRLARVYQDTGRDDDALAAAKQAGRVVGEGGGRLGFEARAQEAILRGDPAAAQAILEDLVERYPHDIEAQIALAEALGQQGELAAAMTRMESAVELDPSEPRAWFLLGKFAIQSGDPRRAVDELLVRALTLRKRLNDEQGQAEVYNAMGIGYFRLGLLDLAVENYQTAAGIRERIGDREGVANTLYNLVYIHLARGDDDAAEADIERALEIQTELGNRAGIADLYNARGGLEEARGNYPEALDQYKRTLGIRKELGDQIKLAEGHTNVGFIYFLLGDYDNALLYHEKASGLHEQGGDQNGLLLALQNIGFCQKATGRWSEAASSFLRSLELSRELGQRTATAVSLGNLGMVAAYQGRFGAAFSSIGEALDILEKLESTRGRIEFTLYEAGILLDLGDLDGAEERIEIVAAWQEESANLEQRAEFLSLRGRCRFARGEVDEAKKDFAAALSEAEASHGAAAVLSARVAGAAAMATSGGGAQARQELRKALTEAEVKDHAVLQLRAAEALAATELAAGDSSAADGILTAAMRIVDRAGSYGRAWRLHQLSAEVQQTKGNDQAAAAALEEAAAEIKRVRENLDEQHRQLFDAIPEVKALLENTPG